MTEESTARRRELGTELRLLRKKQNMSGHHLGRRLEWAPSNISRLETGVRPLPLVDVAVFLASCGASKDERERLARSRRLHRGSLLGTPVLRQTDRPVAITGNPGDLTNSMINYEPLVIPGLLQTEAYARTAFEWDGRYVRDKVDLLVKARMDRQALLHRRIPPGCTFFVHERALRSVVGDSAVMHEQLLSLVLSGNLRHCMIRVVPESASAIRMLGNTFAIVEFADHPAVAYTDTYAAGLFIDDRPAVESYYNVAASLEQNALSVGDSRAWLVQLASEYDRAKD